MENQTYKNFSAFLKTSSNLCLVGFLDLNFSTYLPFSLVHCHKGRKAYLYKIHVPQNQPFKYNHHHSLLLLLRHTNKLSKWTNLCSKLNKPNQPGTDEHLGPIPIPLARNNGSLLETLYSFSQENL